MNAKHPDARVAAILLSAAAFAWTSPEFTRQAQVLLPNTPAGRHVESYFKAFNAGEAAMREFFSGHTAKTALSKTSVEVRLDRYRQMKDRLGSLQLRKVVASRDDFVSVVAGAGNGPIVRLDFQFESMEPFGLLGIRLENEENAGEESVSEAAKKNNEELLAAVRAVAEQAAQAEQFSGVILIAQNGIPLFEQAYGFADRGKDIPNRTDTRFNIGSINKSFTGLAILQLAAQNKLALSDPIVRFLPDYPNKDAAAKVKVRHLLHMTSGLGDFFGERYDATPKENIRRLEDYLPLFADQPLEFEPGSKEKYSNAGYIVLGLIIQKATGLDYYAYMGEQVFKPAGMTDTGWFDKDAPVPNRAIGYIREGEVLKPNTETLPGKGSSAGGGYSTARDLLNYTLAISKGILPGDVEKMGDGLEIAGGAPGLNAALEWDPKSGYVIVVMSNFGPPGAERFARQIRAWLPR